MKNIKVKVLFIPQYSCFCVIILFNFVSKNICKAFFLNHLVILKTNV